VGGLQAVDALPGTAPIATLFPGFDTDGWQGLFAPAGTPAAIVRRLSEETAAALRASELAGRISALGFRAVGSTPEQFTRVVRNDFQRWGRIVRERRIATD
jgi:tripartite-type tricarboxylate transporter receptor subunit TctC